MPIVQCDAKSLEVYALACLSKDVILIQELQDKLDMHSLNQATLGLPAGELGRGIAKIFIFRLVYGGSAYSYAHDSDFTGVSKSEKYWQEKIDAFYKKYQGVKLWHDHIVKTAVQEGKLIMPTGREYPYSLVRNWKGELEAPRTIILNYPVNNSGLV